MTDSLYARPTKTVSQGRREDAGLKYIMRRQGKPIRVATESQEQEKHGKSIQNCKHTTGNIQDTNPLKPDNSIWAT